MTAARHAVWGERVPPSATALLGACGALMVAVAGPSLSSPDATTEVAPASATPRAVPPPSVPAPPSVAVAPSVAAPPSVAVVTTPAAPSVAAATDDAGVMCPPRVMVHFGRSEVMPPRSAYDALRDVARRAAEGGRAVMVEGHADEWGGSDEANLRTSQARARAVAAVLTRAGAPRVRTRAFGAWDPSDAPDLTLNRRVVVRLEGACEGPWTEVGP